MNFSNQKEASQFHAEKMEVGKPVRQTLGMRTAVNRCMYEGAQWISGYFAGSQSVGNQTRPVPNYHPDSNRRGITRSRCKKLIQECHAATFPVKMDCDILPGDRDTGIEAALRCGVLEALLNVLIDSTGYVPAARLCNFRRCVDGTHAMGWGLKIEPVTRKLRNGGEETVPEPRLRAFTCDSTRFTTDPACQEFDLHRHEYLIYTDVWSIDRAKRDMGVELDENECQTMGELLSSEMFYNHLGMNRVYANVPLYSKTKGVLVHQMHVKDESDRFSKMLVGVTRPRKDVQWVNFDNPETPFGGHGMPFTLLHGYPRPDSMWSSSDASLLKDEQDQLNLLWTFFNRLLQKNAGFQWKVATEAMKGQDPDNFKDQFNNAVAGVMTYDHGTRDRPVPAPELINYPQPPPFIMETIGRIEEGMREQVHRPDITAGAYKTHTSNSTFQSAANAANQVLGTRVTEDKDRYQDHLTVGLGTFVKMAREGSQSALAELHRAGFTPEDYQQIDRTDPYYPACDIRIRDSSIKFQSKEQKEQRIMAVAQIPGALSPIDLRMSLADLDLPVSDNDRVFHAEAQRAAVRVLLGEEWQPKQLGEYSAMFLNEFRLAMFDVGARMNPGAQERLQRAVEGQMQADMQATQAQAQAENPQPPQEQPQPEEQQEQQAPAEPSEVDLSTLLQAIQAGSGSPRASAAA